MTTTKGRPVRGKEVQGRINAMKAARAFLAPGNRKSMSEIASEQDSNRHSTSQAVLILEFGSAEEIKGIETGVDRLDVTYVAVRDRTPEEERLAKRRAPTKTEALVQSHALGAEVWGRLRDALDNLTGLPSAADTAVIVRKNNMRVEHVNRKLLVAVRWLMEFENEITK